MFLDAMSNVLPAIKFDHFPLHTNMFRSFTGRRRSHVIFRYEAAWALRANYSKAVETVRCRAIVGDDEASILRNKLANCQVALLKWNSGRIKQDSRVISKSLTCIGEL